MGLTEPSQKRSLELMSIVDHDVELFDDLHELRELPGKVGIEALSLAWTHASPLNGLVRPNGTRYLRADSSQVCSTCTGVLADGAYGGRTDC